MNLDVNNIVIKYNKQYIIKNDNEEEFIDLLNILVQNCNFKDYFRHNRDYVDMLYVLDYTESINQMYDYAPYLDSLFTRDNFNSFINNMIFSKYVKCLVNQDAKNFNELFYEKQIEYVNENYKNNSCFINAIINNFKNSFDIKDKKGNRAYKELTYDNLLKILDIKNNTDDNIGLSISRAVEKFFKHFKLGLDVINQDEVLIYTYRPDKLNNRVNNNIMRIMITNDRHVLTLNNNIKSFDSIKILDNNYDLTNIISLEDKVANDEKLKEIYNNSIKLVVSDKFFIKKEKEDTIIYEKIINDSNEPEKIETLHIINETNDIMNIIKKLDLYNKYYLSKIKHYKSIKNQFEDEYYKKIINYYKQQISSKNINLIYNDNLSNIVCDIYNSYCPKISFDSGNIKDVKIKITINSDKKNKKDNSKKDKNYDIITISRVNIKSSNDTDINIHNIDTLKIYYKEFDKFYDSIFTSNLL